MGVDVSRLADTTFGHIFPKLIYQIGIGFFNLPPSRIKLRLLKNIYIIYLNLYNWCNKLPDKLNVFLIY